MKEHSLATAGAAGRTVLPLAAVIVALNAAIVAGSERTVLCEEFTFQF